MRTSVPLVTRGGAAKVERLLAHAPQAEVISRPELATCLAAARVTLASPTELDELIQAARSGAPELSDAPLQPPAGGARSRGRRASAHDR